MRLCSTEAQRRAGVFLMLVLAAAGVAAQGNDHPAADRLLIAMGGILVDASQKNWEAARRQLDELEARWRALSPGSMVLTRSVEDALAAADRSLGYGSPRPDDVTATLSRLASALDAYVSSTTQGAAGTAGAAARQSLLASARDGLRFAEKGDSRAAAAQARLFASQWQKSEGEVRSGDPQAYASIEIGMIRAGAALRASPPDFGAARDALGSIVQALEDYGEGTPPGGATRNLTQKRGVPDLLDLLRQSAEALQRGDQAEASATMEKFIEMWSVVEGEVTARSGETYALVESDMTETQAILLSANADQGRARALLQGMTDLLAQVSEKASYTFWDSAIILLREGMEALLVLAALLALLKKSGHGGSDGWVWAGAGTGMVLSAAFAVVIGFVLTSNAGGTAREGVEGFAGLASVMLMLTVGAWLHRRSSLQSWNAYLKNRVGDALARGSMWSVFALACLAVLREGGETVVFYAGIAPAISPLNLFGGIVAALFILVVIGFLIIHYSVKLPLHVFFLVATLLIYYLAIKIAGESIHALQVAGTVPAHFSAGLPGVGRLGMYGTWETFLPQAVILLLVLAELVTTEVRRLAGRRATRAPT